MKVEEKDGKWIIKHGGKTVKGKFDSSDEAWSWADGNIDDQVFDDPNSFSPPLEYEEGSD